MLKRRGAVALPPLSPDIFLRSAALVRVVCAVRVVWPCFQCGCPYIPVRFDLCFKAAVLSWLLAGRTARPAPALFL